ncbi:hypothetical protein KCV06_g258, partial [Aureobasidium melanogenum]
MRFPFLHWSNDIILLGGGQENHHYCHKMNMPSDPVYCLRCDESFLLYTAKRIYPSNDALLSKSVLLLEGCLLIVRIRGTAVIGSTVQVCWALFLPFCSLSLCSSQVIRQEGLDRQCASSEFRLNIDFFIVCIGRTFAPFCTCCTLTSHAEVVITFDSNLHPVGVLGDLLGLFLGSDIRPYKHILRSGLLCKQLRKTWSRYAKPNNALFAPQSSLRCNESTCLLGLSTEFPPCRSRHHHLRMPLDFACFGGSRYIRALGAANPLVVAGAYPSGCDWFSAFEHCLRRRQKGICSLSLGSSGGSSAHKLRIDHGVIRRVVESDRVCFLSSSGLFASSPDADTFLDVFVIVPQPSQVGDRKVYKTLHTSGIGNPLGIMTEKSALRLIWLLLRIFSARSCETCVLAMWTRPISILHDCKWHHVGSSEQRPIAPPFVARGTLCRLPIRVPFATDMARTVRLVPSLRLLLHGFLDTTFVVHNDIFLALLIVLFWLCNRASCEEDSFELRSMTCLRQESYLPVSSFHLNCSVHLSTRPRQETIKNVAATIGARLNISVTRTSRNKPRRRLKSLINCLILGLPISWRAASAGSLSDCDLANASLLEYNISAELHPGPSPESRLWSCSKRLSWFVFPCSRLGALFQAETWAKWFSTSMSWPSVESQYSETVLRSLDSVINQMDEPGLSGLPSSPTSLEASTMIFALMADVAHEVLSAHLGRKGAHQITGASDSAGRTSARTESVRIGARAADVSGALIEVEEEGWDVVLKLVVPDLWAIDIFEVDSLATLVLVVASVFEELIAQLVHVSEIMADGEGKRLFGRQVPGALDWSAPVDDEGLAADDDMEKDELFEGGNTLLVDLVDGDAIDKREVGRGLYEAVDVKVGRDGLEGSTRSLCWHPGESRAESNESLRRDCRNRSCDLTSRADAYSTHLPTSSLLPCISFAFQSSLLLPCQNALIVSEHSNLSFLQ